ncbi:hypothetical protein K458DRAFT_189323 [Lentithecium fluviatile CBS 122367]|uniref:Uncharacterized protein n=1 Tax=Lentithecium fluviatile CBS 122367 TaxID=1168545 RepID=A0A6G1JB28_9PLEO|nr:hypothetical protein K458DRAFT_189323 [Lentithecium fluviatile CBS 122367]
MSSTQTDTTAGTMTAAATSTTTSQAPTENTYNIRLTPHQFIRYIEARLPNPLDYHSEIALRKVLDSALDTLKIIETRTGTPPWLENSDSDSDSDADSEATSAPRSASARHPATSGKPSITMKRVSLEGCVPAASSTVASTSSNPLRVLKPASKIPLWKRQFIKGLNRNGNGPPVAVDKAFRFSHKHPLFPVFYPHDAKSQESYRSTAKPQTFYNNDPNVRVPRAKGKTNGRAPFSESDDESDETSSKPPSPTSTSSDGTKKSERKTVTWSKSVVGGSEITQEDLDGVEQGSRKHVKIAVGEGPTGARKYDISPPFIRDFASTHARCIGPIRTRDIAPARPTSARKNNVSATCALYTSPYGYIGARKYNASPNRARATHSREMSPTRTYNISPSTTPGTSARALDIDKPKAKNEETAANPRTLSPPRVRAETPAKTSPVPASQENDTLSTVDQAPDFTQSSMQASPTLTQGTVVTTEEAASQTPPQKLNTESTPPSSRKRAREDDEGVEIRRVKERPVKAMRMTRGA